MCSIVRVCVCATAYVCVYAYVRLRNLQERIETGPAQILANAAGRELNVRAASATLPGDGFSAAEDAAAFRATAAMEAGVLSGLTQP